VALAMQRRSRGGVWRALPPIALGHAAAVGLVLVTAAVAGVVVPMATLKAIVAAALIALGAYRLWRHQHPRYRGMQVGFRDLTIWSFLMPSAHGAGIMLLPWVIAMPAHVSAAAGEHAGHVMATTTVALSSGLLSIGAHTASYLCVMTLAAWIVFHKVGRLLAKGVAQPRLDMGWRARGDRRRGPASLARRDDPQPASPCPAPERV